MRKTVKLAFGLLAATAVAGIGFGAWAQNVAPASVTMADASIKDPKGPVPNPANIPFIPPEKLATMFEGKGEQQIKLFGDPAKPGMYGVLIKWDPGKGSRPHMHDQDRFIYVVSGTWWVSSSPHYDPKTTYPMPQGSFVTDLKNTVHWDGARMGGPPAVLELVGMGPVKTISVDENGKPLPPRPPAAGR